MRKRVLSIHSKEETTEGMLQVFFPTAFVAVPRHISWSAEPAGRQTDRQTNRQDSLKNGPQFCSAFVRGECVVALEFFANSGIGQPRNPKFTVLWTGTPLSLGGSSGRRAVAVVDDQVIISNLLTCCCCVAGGLALDYRGPVRPKC